MRTADFNCILLDSVQVLGVKERAWLGNAVCTSTELLTRAQPITAQLGRVWPIGAEFADLGPGIIDCTARH